MDFLADPVILARMQFAFTAMYHFLLVPVSIGLGLIMAIYETRAYKSGKEEDVAAARFWLKIFTATFALGVATGITMEFSFGTNWADYSRFVGDIFGAPLAAEALLAFFLESTFFSLVAIMLARSSILSQHGSYSSVRRFRRCGSSSRTPGCKRQAEQNWLMQEHARCSRTSSLQLSTRQRLRATRM